MAECIACGRKVDGVNIIILNYLSLNMCSSCSEEVCDILKEYGVVFEEVSYEEE